MRLIDADKVEYITKEQAKELVVSALLEAKRAGHIGVVGMIFEELESIPSADVVPVIRCKDCKYAYFISRNLMYECGRLEDRLMFSDDFCSCGERRGELEEAK